MFRLKFRQALTAPACLLLGVALAASAQAQDVTLRIHHFLPASSTVQVELLEPWAERVEGQSDGRIAIEIYPTMQLGGRAPQLFDQVRDGVVDMVWTLPGYTPGRFPKLEVFELPFVPGNARATSAAAQRYYESHARDELADVHPILVHAHAPGSLHMKGKRIRTLEDIQNVKVRAPTRIINDTLEEIGASPVGMPVPQVPEAISKGVIQGAALPYEVTRSLRMHELTDSHTEFHGERGLYTAVFLFLMNKQRYESLPQDLRQVIDDNSGIDLALEIGATWDKAEEPGREAAREEGHAFDIIEGKELQRWREASQPVIDAWIAERDESGDDGAALLSTARQLIEQYSEK
ncbi:TRAP transporter substrate-binding protein [Fodinicurvata fenggangensis]|uniref:TRAP transporter substrate-binding protein n=1 Tax=Fodinicurvata fenggangensis TaxID=1121830 RepID=UPI00047AF40F|nr:TRAP transporter substrate-binding protein [Fodinicurvata fenggangensis]